VAPRRLVEAFLRDWRPDYWISDRYGGQMGWAKREYEVCLAPLIRDVQYAADEGEAVFAPGMKGLLKRACAIGRRRDALADSTLKIYEADLNRRLDRLMSLIPTHKAGGKLEKIIKKVRRQLFVFVTNRDLTATNNGSERALRCAVKITNGLSQPMGSRALRRYPIRRRNRTAKINPSHRHHPPHPRRPLPPLRSVKT
jgi:transposase